MSRNVVLLALDILAAVAKGCLLVACVVIGDIMLLIMV